MIEEEKKLIDLLLEIPLEKWHRLEKDNYRGLFCTFKGHTINIIKNTNLDAYFMIANVRLTDSRISEYHNSITRFLLHNEEVQHNESIRSIYEKMKQ